MFSIKQALRGVFGRRTLGSPRLFEPLEGRMMLSAVAPTADFSGGILVITGTPKGDDIDLSFNSFSRPDAEGCNEVTHVAVIKSGRGRSAQTEEVWFHGDELKGIQVNTGAGNDRVTAHFKGPEFNLMFNTGAGNDRVNLTVVGFTGENSLNVVGGDGNDRIDLEVWGETHGVGYRPEVNGGAGNDTINIFTLVSVAVGGGDGNDWIDVRGREGGVIHYLSGGDGNDRITTGAPSAMYGDAGNDVLVSTSQIGSYFYGDSGFDIMTGGNGDDVFDLNGGQGYLVLGYGGDDSVQVHQPLENLVFYGGADEDEISLWGDISSTKFILRSVEVEDRFVNLF